MSLGESGRLFHTAAAAQMNY